MFVCVIMSERMTLWLHPHIVLCCVCVLKAFFIKKNRFTNYKKVCFGLDVWKLGRVFLVVKFKVKNFFLHHLLFNYEI